MRNTLGKRCLSALLSALTIVSFTAFVLGPLAVSAAAAQTDSQDSTVPAKYFTSGKTAASAEDWKASSGTNSSIISHSGEKAMRLYSKSNTAAVEARFTEKLPIDGYKELGIYVTSISAGTCTAVLTAHLDSGDVSVSAQIPTGEEHYVFTPLPKDAGALHGISVTLSVPSAQNTENGITVSAIIRKAVFSNTDHSENLTRYSAFAVNGIKDDLSVEANTTVTAMPVAVPDSYSDLAVKIKLSGKGGGISFHYASDGEKFGSYGSAVITEDRSSYIFPIDSITADSAYKIEFTGSEASEFLLEGVEIISYISFDKFENYGVISKCTFANETVSVSGSITRDAAVKYIDGDVCLYEIPMWENAEDILKGDPVDSIKMSTSFSFALPTTEEYSVFTSYIVAIRDDSEVYPLTDPIYPTRESFAESKRSVVSVSGISPENAFTLGFDNYVIDIDLASVFDEKGSQIFTFDGYSYYPNENTASEINKKIQFLSSAGIGVIFRLTANTEAISVKNVDNCRTLAAITAYLSDNFSPFGFMADFTDSSSSDPAYSKASFARLLSAVSGNGSVIYIPEDPTEDTETYIWLLSRYISEFPKFNWEPVFSDENGSQGHIDALLSHVTEAGYSSGYTICKSTGGDGIESPADMLTHDAGRSYIVKVTDSELPDNANNTYKRYDTTKKWDVNTDNAVVLWDFTSSYSSDKFTVPAGQVAIFTGSDETLEAFTGIPACRALKTVLGNNSNVIMAEPQSSMKLSDHPLVRFLMSGVTDSPFSLDIIFISGRERAIFTASFDQSGVYAPVCDLSKTDISEKIDRIAIVLKSGGPVELSIATVTAAGSSGSSDIQDIYITEAPQTDVSPITTDPDQNPPIALMAVGALTVITLVIFIALSRRKPK